MPELRSRSVSQNRIIELDYLRGIAALLIMLYHYTTRYDFCFGHAGRYYFNVPWGYMAVSVFFVLSGYFASARQKEGDTILSFAFKRIIRLYPSYWAAIVIGSAITLLFFPDSPLSAGRIAVNLTMLQGFFRVENVDGAHWTMLLEVLFCAYIGLLLLFKQLKNITKFCLIWILAALAANILQRFIDNNVLAAIKSILMGRYAHMFISGIVISRLKKAKGREGLLCAAILPLCILNQLLCFGLFYTLFYLLVLAFILSVSMGLCFKIPFGSQLSFIAKISYPLYLIHQLTGYLIIRTMESLGLKNEIFLIIPLSVSICLAYLIHRFIEAPAIRLFNKSRLSPGGQAVFW